MATKIEDQNLNFGDWTNMSKDWVTKSRTMATTIRDASLAPMLNMAENNEAAASMMRPWIEMTRSAHDKMLDLYESNSHQMIDRTADVFKNTKL